MSLKKDVWQSVIEAIEAAIPEYDKVNENVSLRRAQKARVYAIDSLGIEPKMIILDAGIGPGTMSEAVLSKIDDAYIVGLDASATLLDTAAKRLKQYAIRTSFVRGIFESLPFRAGSFQRIVSTYAFRDAMNRSIAIEEISRVASTHGVFAIVDIGKPDNRLKRMCVTIYLKYFMGLISWLSKSKEIKGNPWTMIYETYRALGKNSDVVQALNQGFADVKILEFSLGGLIIIFARKTAK